MNSSYETPRPSATVILFRDAAAAPEILLVRRHGRGSFANAYVFPGGMLESQDAAIDDRCRGLTAEQANACLGLDTGGLDWFSAAIRELFEEVGVFLGCHEDGRPPDVAALQAYREPLQEGRLAWRDFLRRQALVLACDALTYCAFWVTPREIDRRYSTRFFLARLPAAQSAEHCGRELIDSDWMTARDALDMHDRDPNLLPRPTQFTLHALSRFATSAELLDWAQQLCGRGIKRIEPAIVEHDGRQTIVMPGDPRYPEYPEHAEDS